MTEPQTICTKIPEGSGSEDLSQETKECLEETPLLSKSEKEISCSDQPQNSSKSMEQKEENVSRNDSSEKSQDPEDNENDYTKNITYKADGSAIYSDAKTNQQYKWNVEKNIWEAFVEENDQKSTASNLYENEYYRWCPESNKWIPKHDVKDYSWDSDKNEWVLNKLTTESTLATGIAENGQRTFTDQDGVTFFWDTDKNAWFPKIDEDFLAQYQMNYGFNSSSSNIEEIPIGHNAKDTYSKEQLSQIVDTPDKDLKDENLGHKSLLGKVKNQDPPKWFDLDESKNTKVYVWNLPSDITLEEFAELMGKCGMIMRDPQTQKYKLKLYTEEDGQNKGDGLCDYIKVESVDLALKILDEYNFRGHKIRVQRAKFQMRGEYNPALKPKRKKKDKEKLLKIKEKLFDWRPEKMRGERSKHEKVVIIKNLFEPRLFEENISLILDYQNDLQTECAKFGVVRKVVIFDRHPEGIAQINMSNIEEADLVIQAMHGRLFDNRKLIAEHWDGKTKYKTFESAVEEKERLSNWTKFLENDDANNDANNDDNIDDNIDESTVK